MITHSTIKIIMLCMMAAVLLNVLNYVFCVWYYPNDSQLWRRSFHPRPFIFTVSVLGSESPQPWSSIENTASAILNEAEETRESKDVGDTSPFRTEDREPVDNCPEVPPNLGPLTFDPTLYSITNISEELDAVIVTGGHNIVRKCAPLEKAAIIVPISCRHKVMIVYLLNETKHDSLLKMMIGFNSIDRPTDVVPKALINHMHTFLTKQLLDYQIYVVQQHTTSASKRYNRGWLINAAFSELRSYKSEPPLRCFVIQEPSIAPVDTRNIYRCGWYPRQLAAEVRRDYDNVTIFKPSFGGAIALSNQQFVRVNGFSNGVSPNNYEDYEDMAKRLKATGYEINKSSPVFGKYVTTESSFRPPKSFGSEIITLNLQDGFNSISHAVFDFREEETFTYISFVSVTPSGEHETEYDKSDRFENIE